MIHTKTIDIHTAWSIHKPNEGWCLLDRSMKTGNSEWDKLAPETDVYFYFYGNNNVQLTTQGIELNYIYDN